ncbi:MAG: hypothetical protein KAS99_02090 [Candidatus Omnitrophica bacterium]|nr:hypothetical protein [Candidatus Omnitrophota bacterium]
MQRDVKDKKKNKNVNWIADKFKYAVFEHFEKPDKGHKNGGYFKYRDGPKLDCAVGQGSENY